MRAGLIASILLLAPASAMAQSTAGLAAISGVVRGPSGASVANARVKIASDTQGTVRSVLSNGDGLFAAPALPPGAGYTVTVTAAGFADYQALDLALRVGQNLNLNVNLTVERTVAVIEVNSTGAIVQDTKTDVSQVIDSKLIQDLPINGRRVDSFVLLTPGVSNDGYFGLLTFRGMAGGNAFLVDGNDTTEQFFNENAGRTRIASQISQDAVQEFQVISSNSSAEFGRAIGGVVNTVTRTGSNDLHGTAYWFFRNRTLDARDRYATINPDEVRNQFGASIGGALIKNKLFYFFNGDFTRRNFPMVSSISRAGVINPDTESFVGCGRPRHPRAVRSHQQHSAPLFRIDSAAGQPGSRLWTPRLAAIGTQRLQRKPELPTLCIAQWNPDEYFVNHGRGHRKQWRRLGARAQRESYLDRGAEAELGE